MLLLASKVRTDRHTNRSVVKHLEKHTREGLDAWLIQTLKLKMNKHTWLVKGDAMAASFTLHPHCRACRSDYRNSERKCQLKALIENFYDVELKAVLFVF